MNNVNASPSCSAEDEQSIGPRQSRAGRPSISPREGLFLLRSVGRRLLWPNPALYRLFGRCLGRGDCLDQEFDVWIDGYPRSANTFCVEAFQQANPAVRVRSHQHSPPFLIHAIAQGKPGIFVIRQPREATVSWAIYWNSDLASCLDYYIDFHRVMRPWIHALVIAPFETVTREFPQVVAAVNRKFGARYKSLDLNDQTVAGCFARIDDAWRLPEGRVDELRVGRPSKSRTSLKAKLTAQLERDPGLRRRLSEANTLYEVFMTHAPARQDLPEADPRPASNRQVGFQVLQGS